MRLGVGDRADGALGHRHDVGRDQRRQPGARRQVLAEVAQVAVGDPDDPRPGRQGPLDARPRRRPPPGRPGRARRPAAARSARRASSGRAATMRRMASAPAARASKSWSGSTVKSLRRTGSAHGRPGGPQVGEGPVEVRPVGQHRQGGGPAGGVAGGGGGGVEARGQRPLRRRLPLDLGDHRHPAVGPAEGGGEVAVGRAARRPPRPRGPRLARRGAPPRPVWSPGSRRAPT